MTRKSDSFRCRLLMTAALIFLGAQGVAIGATPAAPATGQTSPSDPALTPRLKQLLQAADAAQSGEELNLSLLQLRNIVRLNPNSGDAHAYLGLVLLKSGDTRNAELELRRGRMAGASDDIIVPALLDAMVVRGETNELLAEFSDPASSDQSALAADILRARAFCLQIVGRAAEAKTSIARALRIKHDTRNLTASAKIAVQQGDLKQAQSLITEAITLSPTDEDARISQIALFFQFGDTEQALSTTAEFLRDVPKNTTVRIMRIEILLELKRDAEVEAELETLLKQSPQSSFGPYYRAVLLARRNDFRGAWGFAQNLHPEFILLRPGTALMVAEIAIGSGNIESGRAILATLVARRPDLVTARAQLATAELALNNPDAALRTLEPVKTSTDPQVQAVLGQANMQLGRFRDAIGALEKAIGNDANAGSDQLRRQLAASAIELGDTDRAITNLKEIESHQPGNMQISLSLIGTLMQAQRADEALAVAQRISQSAANNPLPAFYRGRVLSTQLKLKEAYDAFSDALAIAPDFTPALYYRGVLSVARGDPNTAKADLAKVLEHDPADFNTSLTLAQILLREGDEARAFSLILNVARLLPNDPSPRIALANLQMSRGRYSEAEENLRNVLVTYPNNPQAMIALGQLRFATGDAAHGIESFRAVAASYPDSPGLYLLLAKGLYSTKDYLAAIDAARRAVELAPFALEPRALLVRYFLEQNRNEDALKQAKDYLAARPGTEADLLYASVLTRMKRLNEANAYLAAQFAANPNGAFVRQLSQNAVSAGDRKKALSLLSDWLKKDPNDFAVRLQYASLSSSGGDTAIARNELETLYKQRPDDPLVLNNLAWQLRDSDPPRAISLVSQAAKITPDAIAVLDTLGWLKLRNRDVFTAIILLRRAHALDEANPDIGYHYAVALDAAGRRKEAKAVLQAALGSTLPFNDKAAAQALLARW